MTDKTRLLEKCHATFKLAEKQLKHLVETHPDYFPLYTTNGKWKHSGEAWTNWCEGFLGGMLWMIYQQNGDPYFREKAEHYSRLIEHRKTDTTVHDLGFLFWSTYKRWYDLTGEPALNEVIIEAGRTAASRFREKGQYLPSFVAPESLFIDIMMNVGIIAYAGLQSGDEKLVHIAKQHCLTTRRYLVRGDGSTSHDGIFNTETGEFLHQHTHQGWRNDSSWARGLTWSLYGFGTMYKLTGDVRFLQTAELNANYYIENTPDHGVPPNDWSEPNPTDPYESSAAAIAASGMLQLAQLTGDPARARLYHDYAINIVDTLTEPEFTAFNDEGYEGILKHGMYHQRKGLGVNESVMWGDHFFLEAVSKVIADVSG